uniref:Uncharacterized protein n=1 Tax=Populus trichocarpa TaxID=3694 RepID=A0A2K1YFR7_POPTR
MTESELQGMKKALVNSTPFRASFLVWSLQRMRKHKLFKRKYSPATASNRKVRR